jgi:hypothetical protein
MRQQTARALADLEKAHHTMLVRKAVLDQMVTREAPCSLCHARPGQSCVKGGFADIPGSGPRRGPHAERRRAAGTKR